MSVAGREAATTVEVAGHPVVLHYGDTAAEYAALHTGALLVDRGFRHRLTMTGPKAADALGGLVTNDVAALEPGHGCYAAVLTAKGKIVSDLRVFRTAPDSYLVDAPPRSARAWADTARKYVNPRLARQADVSESTTDIGVFGPRAHHAVHDATGIGAAALAALPAYAHAQVEIEGAMVRVARVPDLGVEGFELFAPRETHDALWRRLLSAGAMPGGLEAWEIARVEAGRPEWGLDMDENTLVQEANLDELHAISYTKGCYLGQETVARVHFRGHVNRHLRALRLTGDVLPPARAGLVDDTGKSIGEIRSAVLSPRLGSIALGMVRREVAFGSAVELRWDDDGPRGATATVHALPFLA
jgi:folate-binding protein YgfZ